VLLCRRQSEEDIGSAGEQPTRNKIDACTKKGVGHFMLFQPFTFFGKPYVSKNSFSVGQIDVPFNKVDPVFDA
jgi:hypothetical protein